VQVFHLIAISVALVGSGVRWVGSGGTSRALDCAAWGLAGIGVEEGRLEDVIKINGRSERIVVALLGGGIKERGRSVAVGRDFGGGKEFQRRVVWNDRGWWYEGLLPRSSEQMLS